MPRDGRSWKHYTRCWRIGAGAAVSMEGDVWRSRTRKIAAAGLMLVAVLAVTACHKAAEQPARTAAPQKGRPAPPPPPPPPSFSAQDATEALATLRQASGQGFPAARFRTTEIEQRLRSADATERVEGQRLLRAAVLDYARAQHGLTIPVGALPRAWNQRPSRYDAAAELDTALRTGMLQAWLDDLPPQTPEYRALQTAYVAAISNRSDHAPPAGRGRAPGPR